MGANDLLLSLLKAGGVAALSIGVIYLLYLEIIKLRIFPRLRQWQAFALLCLLAVLVFIIAMTAVRPRFSYQAPQVGSENPAKLVGEYDFRLSELETRDREIR